MEIITGIIGLVYVSLAWLFSSIGDNRMGLAALIIMLLLLGSQAVLDAIFQELYKKNVIQQSLSARRERPRNHRQRGPASPG